MKNKNFLKNLALLLLPISMGAGVLFGTGKQEIKESNAYDTSSLPTTIKLNDTSASTIRSYYQSLNNLDQSERQGTNLLKNLKEILKNGQKYYSYDSGDNIWKMYEITDRDWDLSPASAESGFNQSTNTITGYTYGQSGSNPYIHALYINRNVTNQTRAWGNHNQNEWGINREHVWPKAEGFEEEGAGGARGDPMHLMAGNGYSNNIHSNYYYGYVNTSKSYTNCGTKYSNQTGNLKGISKTLGGSTNVFEPQDCDKGDIARAIFYMVARYNFLSGSDSAGIDSNNPNLTLTQSLSDWESSGYSSTQSKTGKMGVMTDLLAWHHADPVDQYEKHRNNLLYENFTNNRNPFVDFPEWVDYIWGTATYSGSTYQSYSSTPTGYAKPSTDTINGYNSGGTPTISVTGVSLNKNSSTLNVGGTEILTATVSPNNATNQSITWTTSNSSVATVSGGIVTATGIGSAVITAKTNDGNFTATCTITVDKGIVKVTSISLDKEATFIDIGGKETFYVSILPSDATDKNVSWTTSDSKVAIVDDGVVTGLNTGVATITAISDDDETITAECTVIVNSGDISLTYDHSPYSGTSYSAEVATKTLDGVEYEYVNAENYTSYKTLSFNKSVGAYLGNKTSFAKPIRKMVLRWHGSYNNSDLMEFYKGSSPLTESQANIVTPNNNGTLSSFEFTPDALDYFKMKVIASTYYVQFDSIEIYFEGSSGTAPEAKEPGIYEKITSLDDIEDGKKYILGYENGTTLIAMLNTFSSKISGEALTISNNQVSDALGNYGITLVSVNKTNGVTAQVYNGTSYLNAQDTGTDFQVSVTGKDWTITYVDNCFRFINTRGIIYSTQASKFGNYYPTNIGNGTYFALSVYKEVEAKETYSLVTSPSDLRTGDDIIFLGRYSKDSVTSYYEGGTISSDLLSCISTSSFDNNTIVLEPTAISFKIVREGDYIRFLDEINGYFCSKNVSSAKCKYETVGNETSNSLFDLTLSNDGSVSLLEGQDSNVSYRYVKFNYNNGSPRFTCYSNTSLLSGSSLFIYKKTSQVEADTWSRSFLNETQGCDLSNWVSLAGSYYLLSNGAKQEIVSCEANASTNYCLRSQAMARYEYILSDPRFSSATNFISGRTISPLRPETKLVNEIKNNTVVIVLLSVLSLSSVAGFIVIKRRKQEVL